MNVFTKCDSTNGEQLAIETSKAREIRLQQMKLNLQQQLATEMPVDRETCRQQMNISQQLSLDAEMPDKKKGRLHQDIKLYKE